jgi:hypothetical protein
MAISDLPFDECCKRAEAATKRGMTIFQKWTCDGCGDRVTANTPNKFTTQGLHEDCGFITDIKKKGCGFMALFSTTL